MTKFIPTVPKRCLLLIAGIVWLAAGLNIMHIGTPDMIIYWKSPLLPLLFSVVVFLLFFNMIFRNMVKKHSRRVMSYTTEKVMVLHFFDKKSYCIMAFMITFGILLRKSNLIPPLYLGTFYTGLGASLMGAGIYFVINFIKSYL